MDAKQLAALSHEALLAEALRIQALLDKERKVSNAYAEELKLTREQNLAVVEQEEEYITNKLMKRLQQLKKEKEILATEVEQEEEFLTNTLQKKLEKLNKEKVDLENRLEVEQEYVVNKLCKQLEQLSSEKAKLHREKVDLENQLEAEQEYIMNKLQKQLEALAADRAGLSRERSDLQRQCTELSGAVDRLNRDKVALEAAMEVEEENIVNRLQRQLEAVTGSYKALEARLEARGLSLRDMGVPPSELPPETLASYSRGASRTSSGELGRASWGSVPRTGALGSHSGVARSCSPAGLHPHAHGHHHHHTTTAPGSIGASGSGVGLSPRTGGAGGSPGDFLKVPGPRSNRRDRPLSGSSAGPPAAAAAAAAPGPAASAAVAGGPAAAVPAAAAAGTGP